MKNDKHILVLNRSFWPDIEATGQFLTELCEQLAKRYRVTVIAGRSYYLGKDDFDTGRFYKKERFNGINILRIRHTRFWKKNLMGRITNWLTYSVPAFFAVLMIKADMIIVCTDPPFLGIIGMAINRLKSAPFIYNCRDLFPDVAIELGRLKKDNFLSRAFNYLNKKAFNSAMLVVCVGQSMGNKIRKKISSARVIVVPDWVDASKIRPISKDENPLIEKFGLRNKFVIMYSGNIGLSQDFDSILEAIGMLRGQPDFCLIFIGEGAGKKALMSKIDYMGIKNVLFLPYQPLEMLSFSLSMADLHLITLKKGMAGTIVPSKVYGIMAVGRPYLSVTDKESEPVYLAEEFKCGLWSLPGDLTAIKEKIDWAINHPNELAQMGKKGRLLVERKFDKDIVINEWFKILEGAKL